MAKALLGYLHSDQRTAATSLSRTPGCVCGCATWRQLIAPTAGRERPPGPGRGCRPPRPPARRAQGDAAGLTGDDDGDLPGRRRLSACPHVPARVGCCGHEVTVEVVAPRGSARRSAGCSRSSLGQQPRRRHRHRGRPAAGRLADATTRSWSRWPRCCSGCRRCSSGLAGALADRLDRRLIVVTVDLLRASSCSSCCRPRSSPTRSRSRVVLVALFLLGTAEVFADNTAGTLMPMLVQARRPGDRATRGCRSASSPSTSWPARRSARRCSRSGWRGRSSAQAVVDRCSACVLVTPDRAAAARPRAERARRRSGTTSSRASAGCCTTPPCARWC